MAFSYTFPENTFTDADADDTLIYSATKTDDTILPMWLRFDTATRTFSGTPRPRHVGTLMVKVTTSDGNGGTVSDTFNITVNEAPRPPGSATASATALVSNFDRLESSSGSGGIFAQGFRTGANTDGYTITSVQLRLFTGSMTSSTKTGVTLRQDENGKPGALVTSLTPQGPLVEGTNTFTAPANTTLVPQTNYFIAVNEVTDFNDRAVYEFTTQSGQSGVDGWSINDNLSFKNLSSQAWGTSSIKLLFISVNGHVITDNTDPEVANSIPNRTATVGMAFNYSFPQNTFTDADADNTLTYSATKANDTDLPMWLSFDAATRTFSGTPQSGDLGTLMVKVTADDRNGGTVSDTFNITVDEALTVTSIVRQDPTSSPANEDSLQWRVTFSMDVKDMGQADFSLTGTTASLTVAAVTDSTSAYDVTASGGNLADLEATVTLSFASGQNIKDTADNPLANTTPTGTNDNSFVVDNTAPALATTAPAVLAADGLTLTLTFNEALGTGSVPASTAFTVKVNTATVMLASASPVTVAGQAVTLTLANAVAHGQTVTVSYTPGTNPIQDAADNDALALSDAPVTNNTAGGGITASLTRSPQAHDGSRNFLVHFEFSHSPRGFSYRTVRDGLFDVTGGRIEKARRLVKRSNLGWEVRIVPQGNEAVTLTARATTDCTASHAACDAEGRKFGGDLALTVPGPVTLPVVSITPSTTTVTEGATATFTLARTGATDAALTVAVSVSETGSILEGTSPTSATFAAGSVSATLSVATEDDEVADDSSTVTTAVSSGTGYEVDDASGSAEAVVEDDDAAPVVGTASPIVVAENATAVATLSATDADTAAADLSWSIPEGEAGGADAAQFALTADGVLSFTAGKDFEAPDDADTDGEYEVTVRVTDGANPVDAALVVRLEDADDAAPVLSGASVDGDKLTVTFGEALDGDSVPPASSFAVTVAGSARAIDSAAVSGSTVVLTLISAVTSGETVTVGYTVPTGADATPVKDAAGNAAAAFADAQVTNETAAALPTVSIAAVSTPVTEGAAAAFTLTRTGAGTAALTVTVLVGQAGSVLDGAPPSSAIFASGASEARLTVATANDAVDEADARVSASIVAGDGYEVDAENASAGVDVFDDDAAAQVAAVEELWSTTLTWTDLGNNWFGGFADGFSNPGWSEDGQAFRIWYISYDAGARTLLMAHDGSGGLIGEPGELSLHVGGHEVGAGEALSAFAGARVGRVGGVDAQWNVGEEVRVRLTRASGDAEAAPAGPAFSVADAQANEASGVPLRFRVTLDAPAQSTVSVRYRTANGTAQAGADYVAAHGALRFARGETARTVEVAVVPDSHNEGSETMTLTLSGPYGGTLADGAATGTISNTGPIPQAWVARFGRTVAEQAIDAVQARFAAPREAGSAGTLAGLPIFGQEYAATNQAQASDTREGLETLAEWLDGTAEQDDEGGLGARGITGREMLSTSSFRLTGGTAESGFASFWGRGAVTSFDGRDAEMTLDGEVASAMVGADFSRDALVGGLMLSHSRGEGGYRDGSGSGTVESTLTALFPYARYTLSERLSVWGMAGYGEGTLTLTPEGSATLRPDMDFLMGALGVRGVLVDGGADGATLTAKSDAFAVRTSTDAVSGSAGNLEASKADVTRVRFALEGARPVRLGESAVLTPSLELGVRHDGGDAETGFGADIGAGLALSDPARGVSGELRARGLLTHEADGMRERSVSGTLSFDPAPETERGLSVSLTQTVGAQGEGGTDRLLERGTLAGLGAQDDGALAARRLDARIGYGLGVLDDRWTAVPELGLGLSDTDRELRLGWRLAERVAAGLAFELGLEGTRREWSDADVGAEHGIVIGAGWWLAGPGTTSFDLRIEAARRDVANDDSPPENTIGLNLGVRW